MGEYEKKPVQFMDKIEWIGIDGALILSYFAVCAVIFSSIYFKIDALTMYVFPLILLGIVWTVFFNYVKTMVVFFRAQGKKQR